MTMCLLLAATATLARADESKAPPKPMEGGVSVDLSHPGEGVEKLKIGNADALVIHGGDGETTRQLCEIAKPPVISPRYLVKGWLKYDDVAGDGYVELWNHFGDDAFFSRTLGDKGPMGKVTGTSGWRIFLLPFTAKEGMTPDKLTLNLVLPGHGTVTVTDVRLVDTADLTGAQTAVPGAITAPPPLHEPAAPPVAVRRFGTWSNLFLVAAAALLVAIGIATLVLLTVLLMRSRLRRASTALELRRMQAMDSV